MPNKVAESHFDRADTDLGLPSITFNLSGDPVDQAAVDAFAYEVYERRDKNRKRQQGAPSHRKRVSLGDLAWNTSGRLLYKVLASWPNFGGPNGGRNGAGSWERGQRRS